MKYYKDENNQIYAYEDDVPEFGSYTEVEQEVPLEEGDEHYGEAGYENAIKIVIVKIPNDVTIKKGLVLITEEEANKIRSDLEEANKPTEEEIRANMQPLSRFQAMTVLKLTKVGNVSIYKLTEQYIQTLSDDTIEDITFKTAWENAVEFRRTSPTIKALQKKFGLNDEQVDTMFTQGLAIEA